MSAEGSTKVLPSYISDDGIDNTSIKHQSNQTKF